MSGSDAKKGPAEGVGNYMKVILPPWVITSRVKEDMIGCKEGRAVHF